MLRLPAIQGTIDRRMLVNFKVDPDRLTPLLPEPFRVKLVGGVGMAGICLIRLAAVRPRGLPPVCTLRSENAAHRIAVEWDEDGQTREGVYIARRDSSSRLNTLLGGRLFPGVMHHARFDVHETDERLQIGVQSDDGEVRVSVDARLSPELPASSVFGSLEDASAFFEAGSLGLSPTRTPGQFDGMELRSSGWKVEPLDVQRVESSFFTRTDLFPAGSATFDNALLMRRIEHEWHDHGVLGATTLTRRAS
jgi:hypothetical protein